MVPVVQRDVPIFSEWIGTLDGMVNADIKAQVSGYLQKQEYTEGSFVKTGQLLFQIDPPRPFQAVLDQAKGSSRDNWRKRPDNWRRPRRNSRSRRRKWPWPKPIRVRTQLDADR